MSSTGKLAGRFGNPLEWSAVDKGIFICGPLMVPMEVLYIVYCHAALHLTRDGELFSFPDLRKHLLYLYAFTTLGILVSLLGLYLRKRRPDSVPFQHLAVQTYAITMGVLGYRVGSLSLITGIVLTGAPLVFYIFFDGRTVIAGALSGATIIFGSAFASAAGWIPYAPILGPGVVGGENSMFWVASMVLFFSLPVFLVLFLLMAFVIYRWRQREDEVKMLAIRDPLTGVYNRRHIMEELDREVARSERENTPVAVIMVDLDHFKRINDRHGHHVGDQALCSAASILENALRKTDQIGRFGGEEFLILLPNTDGKHAIEVAQRCRRQLGDVSIAVAGTRLSFTGSLGVACHRDWDNPVSGDALVQQADEALYRAKDDGRNRVAVNSNCPVPDPV